MPNESAFNRRVITYILDYKETHIKVLSDINLRDKVCERLISVYGDIEKQIQKDEFFHISYAPVKVGANSPKIVKEMAKASSKVNVGPMAAVAGSVAEELGKFIIENGAKEVIVENGGDIFLKLRKERLVGIHAGGSKWSNKIAFKVKPKETPLGICTSSATVGPSINLGEADAICVVAKSAALADAAASAIGNQVKGRFGVEKAVEFGKSVKGIKGFLIIKDSKLALYGKLPEIVKRRFSVER